MKEEKAVIADRLDIVEYPDEIEYFDSPQVLTRVAVSGLRLTGSDPPEE